MYAHQIQVAERIFEAQGQNIFLQRYEIQCKLFYADVP